MADRGWIEGRKDHLLRRGRGAETSDRADRQAWGIAYASPYTEALAIPDRVAAADHLTAKAIQVRIEAAIDTGGWTTNEARRLHTLQKAWALRASGRDHKFNMQGWQRQGTGHHTPSLPKTMAAIQQSLQGDKE